MGRRRLVWESVPRPLQCVCVCACAVWFIAVVGCGLLLSSRAISFLVLGVCVTKPGGLWGQEARFGLPSALCPLPETALSVLVFIPDEAAPSTSSGLFWGCVRSP